MRKVVVVGLGNIGKSIAVALAENNCLVTVITRRGETGYHDLCNFIERLASGNKLNISKSELLSRVLFGNNFSGVSPDADFVIEATEEDLKEKQELFQKIDRIYPSNVILCSVTSSLSINEIAGLMHTPERMVGLHFFNPAYLMKLVEIVANERTAPETVNKAIVFVKGIDKLPIVVADKPGFLVNRILFTMINEAIRLLDDGKFQAEDIDMAMKFGANHPMGPLHLADFIGLDVCLAILENLSNIYGNKYEPHPLLVEKVKNHELGRKTGRGFFEYTERSRNIAPKEVK